MTFPNPVPDYVFPRPPALDAVPEWRPSTPGLTLDGGAVRFRDPLFAATPGAPFPAYIKQPTARGRAFGVLTRPRFAQADQWALAHIAVEPGTSLYGTGEQPGRLLRNGIKRSIWTTDCFGYEESMPSLYQAHPWVLGVRPDGTAFGVIHETTHRGVVDLRDGILFAAQYSTRDTQSPGVTVIEGQSAQEVLRVLARLTGTMPMPPRWAIQYQQCRWSYEPDSRVREIAEGFRSRKLPCGVIWMDIDYMFGYRCFTFDTGKFPEPKALNDYLHSIGFKSVWMIDPGLMTDDHYPAYREGKAGDHFIKNRFGHDFVGKVWPGPCSFPDFTRQRTRDWWGTLYKDYMATGLDGVWNDMNEPAVFDVPNKQMPESNVHEADPELGGRGNHLRYRNIFGMQMVRASRHGMEKANPDKRPFVLTRSNFLGGHRYAATWTGDNKSNWRHLRWSIPMVLNLGLSGQPFVGPDIGGFADNADGELFARWMGIGALLPFGRGHSVKDSIDHEPWSFGEKCEATCRRALERRARLLPYLYTLFRESHLTGLPVARPLFFANPKQRALRAVDDSFLLGDALLVRCNVWSNSEMKRDPKGMPTSGLGGIGAASAPLPELSAGNWCPFELLDPHTPIAKLQRDPDLPELFLKPGSILPIGPVMQFDGEKPLDPLTLVIALDHNQEARGELYEDSGDGYHYEKGDFALTQFEAKATGKSVVVTGRQTEGVYPVPQRQVEVIVLHQDGHISKGEYHASN
jgi:alpha-glucosidase